MEQKSIDEILDELEDDSSSKGRKAETTAKKGAGKKEQSPPDNGGIPTPQPTDAARIPVTAVKTKTHKTNTRGKLSDSDLSDILPSVASVGVLQAIGVTDDGDGSFTLVWGKRRLAAAKKVGLKEVPATVIDPEVANVELASAIENVVRKDLDPVEEANAYKTLIDGYKISQNELAKLIGKTGAHVSQKLALLSAPKKEQEKLQNGVATESSVRKALMKKSSAKPGSKPGRKTSVVNIPEDDLPDGVSMSVKADPESEGHARVTVTFRDIPVRTKGVTKDARDEIAKVLKKLSGKRIDAAYKTIREV